MNKDLIVSRSVVIDAPVSKVWNDLTDPAIIKKYLFGTETVTDWKPGSPIIFQGDYEGTKYRDHGTILENILYTRISYSYWSGFSDLEDIPENYSTVTYDLQRIDDIQTNLTWTQQGYADKATYDHSESGMEAFLDQIKKIMES